MLTTNRKIATAALVGMALLGGESLFADLTLGAELERSRVSVDDPKDEKAKTDKEKLQGTWIAQSGERDGKKLNEFQLKNWEKMIFADDKYTREGGEKREGKFTIDPDKKPKEIDFDFNNQTVMGIYELKGDVLKLVISLDARPTEFESKGGILIVYKKEK
jgi:uncharacterized protein (TIGR03067 family)